MIQGSPSDLGLGEGDYPHTAGNHPAIHGGAGLGQRAGAAGAGVDLQASLRGPHRQRFGRVGADVATHVFQRLFRIVWTHAGGGDPAGALRAGTALSARHEFDRGADRRALRLQRFGEVWKFLQAGHRHEPRAIPTVEYDWGEIWRLLRSGPGRSRKIHVLGEESRTRSVADPCVHFPERRD